MEKRPALGKGLSALIPDAPEPPRSSPIEVDIDRLSPNRLPAARSASTMRGSTSSRESIKANGIIQPIVVRRVGDRFQIIAGERRWRAAQLAGLLRVPIVVRDVAPGQEQSLLEMALIENIQREDLNPIDEALAYRRLADEFHLTQEDIAAAVGKDRATVANYAAPAEAAGRSPRRSRVGPLSMGHARALLSLPAKPSSAASPATSSRAACRCARPSRWSRRLVEGSAPAREAAPPKPVDVHTRAAEDRLKLLLGTRVRIVRQGARGRIEIDFVSEEELIRIYEQLTDRG